jgi:O-antigen ligase
MPPIIALWICIGFIYWLFRMDIRLRKFSSSASLVPVLWLTFISSRFPGFWFQQIGLPTGTASNAEGNPTDLVILLGLIAVAGFVVTRRDFQWGAFFFKNKGLMVLYVLLALSSIWAAESFPTLKRAVKDFGSVMVVLVLLTEKDPVEEIRTVFVRVSYLLLPLSVIFIRYFPEIGRRPSRGGDNMFNGVAWHKSNLGALVFIFGLFILIDLVKLYKSSGGRDQRIGIWIRVVLLAMGFWLMYICASVTSLVCFSIGAFILWGTTRLLRMATPGAMLFSCLAFLAGVGIIQTTFDFSGSVLEALGKNKTLTGRTNIWEMIETANTPFLLGAGYCSFWNSTGAEDFKEQFIWLNSAHNGFLDMYLDGGLVGVSLLILLVIGWGVRSIRRMLTGSLFGRIAFMIWALGLIFNFSETAYFRLDCVWFSLLVMMLECPKPQQRPEFALSMHRARQRLQAT